MAYIILGSRSIREWRTKNMIIQLTKAVKVKDYAIVNSALHKIFCVTTSNNTYSIYAYCGFLRTTVCEPNSYNFITNYIIETDELCKECFTYG